MALPPMHRTRQHEAWMHQALEQARLALSTGDVPIGAVMLDPDGRAIGHGRNEREAHHDPTAHAEVLAMREAAEALGRWRLDECTLVVTLEPCTMCAGAILGARVGELVFGAWEPKTGACGSLIDAVRTPRQLHHLAVRGGVLDRECAGLLAEFFAGLR